MKTWGEIKPNDGSYLRVSKKGKIKFVVGGQAS